jgi:hypothetical protein
MNNGQYEYTDILYLSYKISIRILKLIYHISQPIRCNFFPRKMWSKLTCVFCVEGIISKLINTCTSIIQHLYCAIVRFASKSWDLASLLVNGLLSYPGMYPNVYIASHVIPGIYAASVAKCSQVYFKCVTCSSKYTIYKNLFPILQIAHCVTITKTN